MQVGALWQSGKACLFRVFAPEAKRVRIRFPDLGQPERELRLHPSGYWEIECPDIQPGTNYLFSVGDGEFRPDPASRYQPFGVHGPSQVWDHGTFAWKDSAWTGIALEEAILYEIHVGAFTPEGTLDAIIPKLEHLAHLGVNAIEIMPVNQFPGERNWGYDGAYLYAVQNSYGGPEALKRLVDAAHARGIAVVLDVVYNHLGPEGNYLAEFGPYFTDHYKTPWGKAVNLDGKRSDQVRDFFIENALYWLREFHIDGLRLDAIHQMYDMSATHFLAELEERVAEFSLRHGRRRFLIAESDLNDPGVITGRDAGGYGMQAQWLDDFQHCVDALLRKETSGYRLDYGRPDQLAKAFREGFVYSGEYCPSREKRFGASSALRPPRQFVAFIQNHDQVGNRPGGERFNAVVDAEAYKLAAGTLFLSPYLPLLFMGEEYAETRPFQFFGDYGDPQLSEAVRKGRREEFAFLHADEHLPDPIAPGTFEGCKLDWASLDREPHRTVLRFYRRLIALRKGLPALSRLHRAGMEMDFSGSCFFLRRRVLGTDDLPAGEIAAIFNYGSEASRCALPTREGKWESALDSADTEWGGPGSRAPRTARPEDHLEIAPHSFVLYRRTDEG
ncbi:MAG: malto-oligosyltrehalose trehalohydrolase [Fibrobacteres bacterium]|nr:malto-oligosyltrehalose trehalohydrolase [Fibrobacterota bacterium]